MATGNSVQYGNYSNSRTFGPAYANPMSEIGSKVRCSRFDFEAPASFTAGSTINLTVIPAGARFLYAFVAFEGTGSLTLDIGDSGDTDRLVAAADLGTDVPTTGSVLKLFGRIDSTAFGTTVPTNGVEDKAGLLSSEISVGIGYKYTSETVITGTTGGATMASGEVMRGAIFYTVD